MKYERPEMEVLSFGDDIRALDIVGGYSQTPGTDTGKYGDENGEW